MSLSNLAPTNTKRARENAARSFKKFLETEGVTWEYKEVCMKRENAPLVLEAVVDKFGMVLAFKEGRKGQLLARHSVMQYYRQTKNWLLDQFPHLRPTTDKALLKKGQVLERYCMKRESGTFVNKAPACTTKSLKQMVTLLYSTAVTASDYQDAALLCLLWFLFGRASDPVSTSGQALAESNSASLRQLGELGESKVARRALAESELGESKVARGVLAESELDESDQNTLKGAQRQSAEIYLTLLRKANLFIGSGNLFFVRFIRVKTSEEQGLSLFPDDDFTTCPLLAIAAALATQSAPTASLLSQLPEQHAISQSTSTPTTPLIDLIDHPEDVAPMQSSQDGEKPAVDAPGIHSYVNRVLGRVAEKAGVTERLTSHSFRRGGAQHANGAGMCVQWIFDRGAWNMTATNKAFAYVFNTPAEDHKIARALSSRHPDAEVPLLSLDGFDSNTQAKIRSVASVLFVASSGLDTTQYNVNTRVLDTLTAYLLRHYPALKALATDSLVIKRLEACAVKNGFSINDLLAWSSHLTCDTSTTKKAEIPPLQDISNDVTKHPVFLHQTALIEQLIQVNKTLDARLSVMETKICNKHQRTPTLKTTCEDTSSSEPPSKRRRTSPASSLKDAWFTWYAYEPRMWSSTDSETKHMRSNTKLVVAFLKLFLPDGFQLDVGSPRYRDEILDKGASAEKALLAFLHQNNITARGAQNVLKSMRKLHKSGHLNEHIQRYKNLQRTGLIVYPAPPHTCNIIEIVIAP